MEQMSIKIENVVSLSLMWFLFLKRVDPHRCWLTQSAQ